MEGRKGGRKEGREEVRKEGREGGREGGRSFPFMGFQATRGGSWNSGSRVDVALLGGAGTASLRRWRELG